jgi:hypothetical protein
MALQVTEVNYVSESHLLLKFSNQQVQEVDLADELYGEIFEPLRDLAFFQQVFLNPETNTIEWLNGADFAPEFLYELGSHPNRLLETKA